MANPEVWTRSGSGGGLRGHSDASPDWAPGAPVPFQERIRIPRAWQPGEAKPENDSDNEEDRPAAGTSKGKSGDRRGGYKCGRCGQPKKGHVCTNKPRLRAAFVETTEVEIQAERDAEMVLRRLDTKLQGYPESYGLTFRWAPSAASLYAAQQQQQEEQQQHSDQRQPQMASQQLQQQQQQPLYERAHLLATPSTNFSQQQQTEHLLPMQAGGACAMECLSSSDHSHQVQQVQDHGPVQPQQSLEPPHSHRGRGRAPPAGVTGGSNSGSGHTGGSLVPPSSQAPHDGQQVYYPLPGSVGVAGDPSQTEQHPHQYYGRNEIYVNREM
ncbi:hypothetical protein NGA_0110802 [Nannochloropsis gaditana CCMP526]|uniref:uncharacterized protein n=1 Tax=Nannochloropsis gaditana (strain CCMP526) TaxID=1093141 RepID=UPI00029F61DC|nr:hypothetical protein NGA_0110802 [Nannochloropsis gaditana CCMP526]XP_005855218.1 hypothetical protein NGA_0110801 [Nannochloropsis gaditana CCMP526]EKU21140.1 hypothetical protein NGA_0110801 [Nannochloropsis gaditana CCMP526]EKU22309.1 hypothetical protein NGA_0110802 [Nannochloropsis gaditana CCMP526]|eukprot:XP_005854050.1 hypothetical protein NGA_0110802 [Nannochloropsis gaditana CCMP526]